MFTRLLYLLPVLSVALVLSACKLDVQTKNRLRTPVSAPGAVEQTSELAQALPPAVTSPFEAPVDIEPVPEEGETPPISLPEVSEEVPETTPSVTPDPLPVVQAAAAAPQACAEDATDRLHVAAVYQPIPFGGSGEVTVTLNGVGCVALVLSAYHTVHWKILQTAGAKVGQVIINGYHSQTLFPIAGITPLIGTVTTHRKSLVDVYPYEAGSENMNILVDYARLTTGLSQTTVNGDYYSSGFQIAARPASTLLAVEPKACGPSQVDRLHIVGVYEGTNLPEPNGKKYVRVQLMQPGCHAIAVSSYAKSRLLIQAIRGAKVGRVLINGYERQEMAPIDGVTPTIKSLEGDGAGLINEYPFVVGSPEMDKFATYVMNRIGIAPKSIQGAYESRVFQTSNSLQLCGADKALARLSPTDKAANVILSQGNLVAEVGGDGLNDTVRANSQRDCGKWYFEVRVESLTGFGFHALGISQPNESLAGVAPQASYDGFQAGDVIGIAADLDTNKLYIRRNGVWVRGNPATGLGAIRLNNGRYAPALNLSQGDRYRANFGGSVMLNAAPVGFRTGFR